MCPANDPGRSATDEEGNEELDQACLTISTATVHHLKHATHPMPCRGSGQTPIASAYGEDSGWRSPSRRRNWAWI